MTRALSSALLLLLLFGCEAEPRYSDEHESDLRFDCEQTIACDSGPGAPLSTTAVDACIERGGDKLDRYPDTERRAFMDAITRCSSQQGCAYLACLWGGSAYSQMHAQEIRYDCEQRYACRVQRGEALPAAALDECVSTTAATLDASTEESRAGFEAHFARCNTLQICAYADCQ